LAGRQAFRFSEIGPLELRGLTSPGTVYEVPYQQDEPAALLAQTPFVGRTTALARRNQRLRDARASCGAVVPLEGEAAIRRHRPRAGRAGRDGARRRSDGARGPWLRGGGRPSVWSLRGRADRVCPLRAGRDAARRPRARCRPAYTHDTGAARAAARSARAGS